MTKTSEKYLPEGYPEGSTVLKEQVRELLRKGAKEIKAGERYLSGSGRLTSIEVDSSLSDEVLDAIEAVLAHEE